MRVLKAQVYNPENEAFADIELPASYEELADCLQMINGTNESCAVNVKYFLGDVDLLQGREIQSCSLYEMNYFSTLIDKMQEHEQLQFAGLVECYNPEYPQMKEITNLALNAPTLDCHHAPATTDKEIGEFYIDNELLPQLADLESLSDEQYDWVCDHLDKEKIGKEMREQEHGVFTYVGYFVKNEEIKQFYNGEPVVPKPCDYIFRLEIAIVPQGDEPNDQNTISLKLPAAQADILRTLEEIGAKSMDDCCFYGYESLIVQQLADCYGDNEDFNALNHLAERINRFDNDNLVKFKAMLETVECKDIETAIVVYEHMDEFTLDRSCTTATDYVDKVLENLDLPMKEKISNYLSTDGYGKALMKHNGIDKTSYGMLIPNDGIKLSEQIQKQNDCVEMTMSM
ncbi:hypothetical protein [Faecalispora anaeroviscerum]|uniref:hypothetical protein n=1 Tax=Faecalispora anaeroviscerum TaxID=2991836 RepID=UPI0024BAF511|nr:hypothetical protein [Faecalispora anaeroviscerum]